QLEFRGTGSWEYGYWWIEWGGQHNAIRDNERIRFELLSIVLGVWDYIKNSGEHPDSANWGMTWLGMVPGKRSSRRLVGPHYLTQQDLLGLNGDFDDAVAIGGWPFDNHPPAGFDDPTARPADQVRLDEVYNIPLRALYSVNIDNLFMAGRNVSASHVAFTSMRVMATCAVEGQAIGTAAALCAREGLLPREVIADPAKTAELQQALLRDDQTIKGRVNADPLDFARHARVTASSEAHGSRAVHVINGRVRDLPEAWENRWGGVMTPEGAWIELAWDMPQRITHVQLYFDSGFHRELTLSESHAVQKRQIRGPQPETVKDYELLYRADVAGPWETLVTVRDNYQRLRRHTFRPVEAHALRLHVTATNGAEEARVYEIRCYG
ncbi:MAG TPA: FAD-dependent oxidoreductase, partial [Candidatus Hydrogenedentes bacterium]|nr:FAD-dependent oxidoreductase [Candidatus Hydrogenedentota bacterium]